MSAISAESPGSSATAALSSSGAKGNAARTHRVARKRKSPASGPPSLQWVIAQDPSEFKDEKTKRSVRSQAMIQYRYRARTDKKAQKEKIRASSAKDADVAVGRSQGAVVGALVAVTPDAPLATPEWDGSDDQHQLFRAASAAVGIPNPPASGLLAPWARSAWSQGTAGVPGWPTPRWSYTLQVLNSISLARRNGRNHSFVVSPEEQAEGVKRLVHKSSEVALSPLGNPSEPFEVLPRFCTAELNRDGGAKELITIGIQAFVSKETMDKWFPAMAVHKEILLSATTIISTWRDWQANICGDSRRTILLKNEIISYINARLRVPFHQFEDATLMIILHLIAGEMWSCDDDVLRMHEKGVAQLINHRGGLDKLGGNGATAAVSAACCLQADVICEQKMLPLFQNWDLPKPRSGSIEDTAFVPESPLLCPRNAFFTIAADRAHCAPFTFELLCDMRDLTNIFVAHHLGFDAAWDINQDLAMQALAPGQYPSKLIEIIDRLASLPSAYVPGLPTTGNWIYESCRIASIIYASAIFNQIPFSDAAKPGRASLLSRLNPEAVLTWNGLSLQHVHLSEALFETLKKSNLNEVWGDMSGVLYWVCLVGASAARSTNSNNTYQKQRPANLKSATWVRRCLIMYATRAMIILIFQYPEFIIQAQRKLLAVQGLVETGRTVARLTQ